MCLLQSPMHGFERSKMFQIPQKSAAPWGLLMRFPMLLELICPAALTSDVPKYNLSNPPLAPICGEISVSWTSPLLVCWVMPGFWFVLLPNPPNDPADHWDAPFYFHISPQECLMQAWLSHHREWILQWVWVVHLWVNYASNKALRSPGVLPSWVLIQ